MKTLVSDLLALRYNLVPLDGGLTLKRRCEMKNKVIKYKGFEILHRHVFNNVWFEAWQGNNKVGGICGREIRMDNRDIDWDNPLTKEEKEFLVTKETK